MSKKVRYSVLAILSLVMIFAVFGSASAQEAQRPLRNRGVLRGEISAIDGTTITLELPQRSVQVITDDETHFHIIGQETTVLSDFNVGDTILARGQRLEDGTMRASVILMQPDGDMVWGRVTAVDETSLLVNGRDQQEITITVSSDTIVAMIGQELTWDGNPAGSDSLYEGAIVAAFGTIGSDGLSLDAHTLVTQRPQRPQGVAGTIDSIADNRFTITTLRDKTVTVLVNDETRYRMRNVENPTLADFAVGDEVVIIGQPGEEDTFNARIVAAVPENRPHGRPVTGEILAINGDEISLTLLRGQTITVITNPDTIFRVGRDNEATLEDFASGDMIAVFGSQGEEAGTLLATHVMKRR